MSEYIVRMPSDMPYEIKAELNAWYVNSEPIIRCRDCKHYVHSELLGGDACDLQDDFNEYHWLKVEPDGFCAWGERAIERKLYRSKEDAERLADEVEALSSDEMHYGARVVEFEVVE